MATPKLTNDQIVKIYLDAISGEKSLSEIAKEYNVSPATVRRIKNKELKKQPKQRGKRIIGQRRG